MNNMKKAMIGIIIGIVIVVGIVSITAFENDSSDTNEIVNDETEIIPKQHTVILSESMGIKETP